MSTFILLTLAFTALITGHFALAICLYILDVIINGDIW